MDLDYRLVTFNRAFQESILRNYGNQVAVGKLPEELVSEARAVQWRKWFAQALSEGMYREEFELLDGKSLLMTLSRITQEGVTTGVGFFGKDITKRKAAQRAALEAERIYRDIINGSHIGFYRTAPEGQVLMINPALARMLGTESIDEVLMWNLEEGHFAPGYSREKFKKEVDDKGEIRGLEEIWQRHDGTKLYVRESAHAIRGGSGEVLFYEGTVEDITHEKQAEEKYQEIFDGAIEGIYRRTIEGKTLVANLAMAKMLGYASVEEFMAEPAASVARIWGDEQQRADFVELLRERGVILGYECQFKRKDGTTIWVSLNSKLIAGGEGEPLYIEGFIEDISERKRAEALLSAANAHLSALIESNEDDVLSLDLDFRLVRFNEGFKRNIENNNPGMHMAAGMLPEEYLLPARAALWRGLYERALAEGPFQEEFRTIDGRVLELSLNRIVQDGVISGVSVFGKEITAQKEAERALLEAVEKYREIFEGAIDGIYRTSLEGKPLLANSALARMLGYASAEEFLSVVTDSAQQVWADSGERARFVQLLRDQGEVLGFECQLKRKDGTIVWVVLSSRLVRGNEGEALYNEGFIEDITRRKRAEETARKSTEELKEAQRIAHLGNWTRDLKQDRAIWSDEMFAIMGRDPALHSAPSYAELEQMYSPESWARMTAELDKSMRTGIPYEMEQEFVRPDGSKGWVLARAEPVQDATGEVVGLRGISLDISERKRAEEAAKKSTEELKEAQRIAHLGNWTLDLKTGQVTWSDEMYRIMRVDPSLQGPLSYTALERMLSPESWARLNAEIERAVLTGVPYEMEQELVLPDGSKGWILTRGEPLRDASGEVVSLRGIAMDISERKRAEEALRKSETELNEAQRIAHLGNWTVDLKTGKVTMSDEMFRLKGLGSSLHGAPQFLDLEPMYSPESWARLNSEIEKTKRTGMPYELELETVHPDGSRGWVLARGEAERDATGEVVVLHGISLDISERKWAEEAVRKIAAELQEAQRIAHLGNWTLDIKTGQVTWSDEMYRMTGLEPSPQGAPSFPEQERTFTPESWARLNDEVKKILCTGRPYEVELETMLPDGRRGWVQARGEAVRDARGEVVGLHGISMDISERKRAEEAFRKSEAELKEAQRIAHLGNWSLDLKTGCDTWSAEMFRIMGLEPSPQGTLSREELERMFTPESWERLNAEDEKTARTGIFSEVELETVRADGSKGWILSRGEPMRDASGEVVSLRGISMDISERKRTEEALRKSEAELKEAQRIARLGNWTVDLKTGQVTMSDETYRMNGLESPFQGAAQFMELERMYSPESWARLNDEVKKILCTGRPYEVELETMLPDGRRGWVQARGEAVRDARGEVVGLHGTSLDISERKLAEEAVRKIAAELQEAQRIGHVGNWARDLKTGYTTWSDEMFRMRGLEPSPQGVLKHADLEPMFTPESWVYLNAEGDKAVRTGLPYEVELETVLPDGSRGWVHSRGKAVRDATGKVVGLHGISMDITERRQAEEAVRKIAAELQDAQRIAHVGNWARDLKTGYTTWSDEMFRMRGLERSPKGAPMHAELERMFTPESWVRLNVEGDKAIRTGLPYEVELETVRSDGSRGWVLARGEAERDATGKVVGLRGISMDISEQKRAEAEKATLEAQLIQAQKLEAVGQLAGGIAHDFNNLLMVISAHTELLALKLEGAAAERAEAIMKATRRAAELTGQLLAFSRKQTTQPTVTTMNQLVTGVSDMLQRLVGEDVEVKVALNDKPLKVKTDRAQFEQVIMNLVLNARDAMPDGGRLTLETASCEIGEEYQATHPLVPAGKYAMLAVSDTGTGMSAEVLARVFEPFYTTKPAGKGTGLGLSLVYGIVKQSGGFVWGYSEVGKGTCFKIYLPEANGNLQMVAGRSADYKPETKKKATILLVEDEDSLREVVGNFLRSGGHKVIEVGTVEDACAAALEHRLEIDLVLTDVVLKGGNAKQLVKRLEEQGCSFRVVFMSGYTPNAIVHHGVLEPGTFFLQKPFSRSVLLDKIEDALATLN